jgi:hypothetical protein
MICSTHTSVDIGGCHVGQEHRFQVRYCRAGQLVGADLEHQSEEKRKLIHHIADVERCKPEAKTTLLLACTSALIEILCGS